MKGSSFKRTMGARVMARRMAVIGAGAWGAALAQTLAAGGRAVTLWAHEPEVADAIERTRENKAFLPGIMLHHSIHATSEIGEAGRSDAILAVVPAQHMRATLKRLAPFTRPGQPIVLCAKGVEQGSLALMTQVLAETIPHATPAVLSGPSFAKDVARGLPTAVTLACADRSIGAGLAQDIGSAHFRPYLTDDLIGAEVGGAVKNVLAIACGIAEGLGLGESARAAMITRGFAEMTRLGVALGAKPATLAGLCGLGDLVLTCSSIASRNFALGFALGEGQSPDEALSGKITVAEGAASAPAVAALALRAGVEMPISEVVAAILDGRVAVREAVGALLARPFKVEAD
jgi:glycerol-3-phosphate dehydrogenase (NAD(P)+)